MNGHTVHHKRHGVGHVIADLGATVVVRFDHGIEQLLASELVRRLDPATALASELYSPPIDAMVKAQALAITSCNDQWGVYSRSRIQLLPHQLWVCRQVMGSWPFRWLIADDVGLGKTIEAGLIMMPLMASGRAQRVLVLAPAKLVPQWRQRLKDMFDLRLMEYAAASDSNGAFWDTADRVVGSIHTLRNDERRKGLLEAPPWDLVVVDEAHHLSVDERGTETLSYSLLQEMQDRGLIGSLLLFTGTPHRGKNAAFFGLMKLVRPDLFDPKAEPGPQFARLSEAMIRNNKATVTDLKGVKLFKPVTVQTHEFSYTAAEEAFYRTMSDFILDGRAYADTLDARGASARMLLLTTLQKLAASSVAAIRSAFQRRRAMLVSRIAAPEPQTGSFGADYSEDQTLDDLSEAEEMVPVRSFVEIMRGEVERIDELLVLADAVEAEGGETKIARLLALVTDKVLKDEQVLFFTEYKATQALVLIALEARFGAGCTTFINGDERLDLPDRDGRVRPSTMSRLAAAAAFNNGERRFLVSTEAAGEGIDLQERCSTLVHVDLPWNPMRMHQRVGRLSRYGQSRDVVVHILRNPDTVEARIWGLLDEKLERIQAAFSSVMGEQEDIRELVVGMAGNGFFDGIFADASSAPRHDRLGDWFDARTAQLDGRDIVKTVREMFGNVRRFDFASVSDELPRSDLPDLEGFIKLALRRHGRRIQRSGSDSAGLEALAPEKWIKADFAIRRRYEGLTFDRSLRGPDAATRVLGVGHALMDTALAEAASLDAPAAAIAGLQRPIMVFGIRDQVTDTGAAVRQIVMAVEGEAVQAEILRDWELVQRIDRCARPDNSVHPTQSAAAPIQWIDDAIKLVMDHLPQFSHGMRQPSVHPLVALLPNNNR